MLNRRELDWDLATLGAVNVGPGSLGAIDPTGTPLAGLTDPWRKRWPALADVPWYPPLGDGLCSNLGTAPSETDAIVFNIGTSAAVRALVPGPVRSVPAGLWEYRVDRSRSLLGGAESNGGNVAAWLRDLLRGVRGDDPDDVIVSSTARRSRPHRAALPGRRAQSGLGRRCPRHDSWSAPQHAAGRPPTGRHRSRGLPPGRHLRLARPRDRRTPCRPRLRWRLAALGPLDADPRRCPRPSGHPLRRRRTNQPRRSHLGASGSWDILSRPITAPTTSRSSRIPPIRLSTWRPAPASAASTNAWPAPAASMCADTLRPNVRSPARWRKLTSSPANPWRQQ